MIGIYKITNPNKRIYIGQSTNIEGRWIKYKQLSCKDQPSLYSSLKKYGPENHIFEIIEECNIEQLDEHEIYWGKQYDVLNNFNLHNRLGRGFGSFDSDETKRKKSESNKGISRNKGNSYAKGHKLSPKSIQNITEKRKKPIYQLDKQNNIIKEWPSIKKASQILNIQSSDINNCCRGKNKTAGGYKFKYK